MKCKGPPYVIALCLICVSAVMIFLLLRDGDPKPIVDVFASSLNQTSFHNDDCRERFVIVNRSEVDRNFCRRYSPLASCVNWSMNNKALVDSNKSASKRAATKAIFRGLTSVAAIQHSSSSSCVMSSTDPEDISRDVNFVSVEECFRTTHNGKKAISMLFVGHSHTRYLFGMLCLMVQGTDCNFTQWRKGPVLVREGDLPAHLRQPHCDKTHIRLLLLQQSFSYRQGIQALRALLTNEEIQAITHVVFSRGMWDALYWDNKMTEIAFDFADSLRALFQFLGTDTVRILHMPHHVEPPRNIASRRRTIVLRSPTEARNKICFSQERIGLLRDMNQCVAANVSERIFIFDVFSLTASAIARDYVDRAGHHYTGVILELQVMMLLNHFVCPKDESRREAFRATPILAMGSCGRIESAASHFSPLHECSCHRPDMSETLKSRYC